MNARRMQQKITWTSKVSRAGNSSRRASVGARDRIHSTMQYNTFSWVYCGNISLLSARQFWLRSLYIPSAKCPECLANSLAHYHNLLKKYMGFSAEFSNIPQFFFKATQTHRTHSILGMARLSWQPVPTLLTHTNGPACSKWRHLPEPTLLDQSPTPHGCPYKVPLVS